MSDWTISLSNEQIGEQMISEGEKNIQEEWGFENKTIYELNLVTINDVPLQRLQHFSPVKMSLMASLWKHKSTIGQTREKEKWKKQTDCENQIDRQIYTVWITVLEMSHFFPKRSTAELLVSENIRSPVYYVLTEKCFILLGVFYSKANMKTYFS